MDALVYPRERTLGTLTLVLGAIAWLAIIVGTLGGALIGLALGFLLYVFAQSAFIAHIRGQGVRLSSEQYPELYAQFVQCCTSLQIDKIPEIYILAGNGGLNAFATKFFSTHYVVLLSDVVDAMEQHPDGVRFYMGHELGHLRRKHLNLHLLRWPVLWLPLLGAAYSRACESTCDLHGRACCATAEGAARSLAALSAGVQRWKDLDLLAYQQQALQGTGFWMSFHELTAAYPWLSKRVLRVAAPEVALPKRSPMAYVLALFVPYAGRLGAGFGLLLWVYVIGILAAIALPAYQDYTARAKFGQAVVASAPAREALKRSYETTNEVPESLSAVGIDEKLSADTSLELDADTMALTITTPHGALIYTPSTSQDGKIEWTCTGGESTKLSQLPPSCT